MHTSQELQYGLYTGCTRPVHGRYTANTRPVHGLYTADRRPVHVLYTAYTRAVHGLYTSCKRPVHGLYTSCTRPVHGLYTACTWPVHGLDRAIKVTFVDGAVLMFCLSACDLACLFVSYQANLNIALSISCQLLLHDNAKSVGRKWYLVNLSTISFT